MNPRPPKKETKDPRAEEKAPEHQGLVIAHYGVAVDVRLADKSIRSFRKPRRMSLVVGDLVDVGGSSIKPLPRKNELRRRASSGQILSVVANIDICGVVIAPQPTSPPTFLDQALIAISSANIPPMVICNKVDLPDHKKILEQIYKQYEGIYSVVSVSASENIGIQELSQIIAQKGRAVFVGISGVGKSSLVNCLKPDAALPVSSINKAADKGRHTTSVGTLHELELGGEIVDTPGVREFLPVDAPPEAIGRFFPDFINLPNARCRFQNCLHESEPGCSIKDALTQKLISKKRYDIYLDLMRRARENVRPSWQK